MSRHTATDESYWADYDGLQHAKHQFLKRYLGGWFPILSKWSGRVIYIDCHAGRGRHRTGHQGSPLLALETLLTHKLRDRILASTGVTFVFFEISRTNCDYLEQEIADLGDLPAEIAVHVLCDDYERGLRTVLQSLRDQGQELAPSFAFIDPYGFSLSMDFLNDFLSIPRSELLITFMYRYIDMAMHNPTQVDNLDQLFGTPDWRTVAKIEDYTLRIEETLGLFSRQLQAQYVTPISRMMATNGTLKYALIHATNHEKGRETAKEAMWAISPDGSFTAFENQSPDQLMLIQTEPDLEPLKDALWCQFADSCVHMAEIYEWLHRTLYRRPHLHTVLRPYRRKEILKFQDYAGRFAFGKNPLVCFPAERPD